MRLGWVLLVYKRAMLQALLYIYIRKGFIWQDTQRKKHWNT